MGEERAAGEEDAAAGEEQSPLTGGTLLSVADVQRRGLVALVATTDDQRSGFCSGTLIADRLVVTAGHCARTPRGPVAYAAFAADAFAENRVLVPLAEFVRHPTADLAIARLAADAPGAWARLPLAHPARASRSGDLLEIAGFGRQEADRPTSGGVAQKLAVRLASLEPSSPIVVVTATRAGACFGDSGGPAYGTAPSRAVVGVLSNGNPGCRGGDTYTSVGAFESWIRATAGAEARFADAFTR